MKDVRIRKVTTAIVGTLLAMAATVGFTVYCLWEDGNGDRVAALRELEHQAQPVWRDMVGVITQKHPAEAIPVSATADVAAMRALLEKHHHLKKVFHVSPDLRLTWVTREGVQSLDMADLFYRTPLVGKDWAKLDRETRRKLIFVGQVYDSGVRTGRTFPSFRHTWGDLFLKGSRDRGYLGYDFDFPSFLAEEGKEVLARHGLERDFEWDDYRYEQSAVLKPQMALPDVMATTVLRARDLTMIFKEVEWDQRLFIGLGLMTFVVVGVVGASVRQVKALLDERELALAQSNFVSAVSHEMRTPLTTIKMYAEMMEHGIIGDPEKQLAYLRTIGHESDRLARLVENVLGYARVNRGNLVLAPEPLEVADVVAEAVVAARGALEQAGVEVQTDLPPGLRVTADHDALVQVLVNLVTNAAKYAADGKLVFVRGVEQGGEVTLTVKDFGPGIPAGEHKKVFQPFYRMGSELTRTAQGTGLGLALVEEYMKAQGGAVTLDSQPGQGAAFRLVFPREGRAA